MNARLWVDTFVLRCLLMHQELENGDNTALKAQFLVADMIVVDLFELSLQSKASSFASFLVKGIVLHPLYWCISLAVV